MEDTVEKSYSLICNCMYKQQYDYSSGLLCVWHRHITNIMQHGTL